MKGTIVFMDGDRMPVEQIEAAQASTGIFAVVESTGRKIKVPYTAIKYIVYGE